MGISINIILLIILKKLNIKKIIYNLLLLYTRIKNFNF